MQGYASAARALGAHIRVGCEVLDITTAGGEITGVVTSHGTVATGTVICAAGAWSRACGAMVGVDLPVTPLKRQILFTEPMDDLPADLPMTIDFASSFYFHREGPGLLLGMSDPAERPGFGVEQTDDWVPGLIAAAAHRAPRVAEAGIRGGWAGLYEMTPDHNAIIGEAAGVSRFLYATGFSGHGFLQGPAVGEMLRDLVLGRPGVRGHRAAERRALRRRGPTGPSSTSSETDADDQPPPARAGSSRRSSGSASSSCSGCPACTTCRSGSALSQSAIRLVGVRHEQTAVYAADGYARATGRLGVALVTTGPGAANTLGATGEAMAASSPVLVIATDIASDAAARRRLPRRCCTRRATRRRCSRPVTKARAPGRATPVSSPPRCSSARRSRCGPRRGPVYLGVPTDLLPRDAPRPAGDPPAQPPAPRAGRRSARPRVWSCSRARSGR